MVSELAAYDDDELAIAIAGVGGDLSVANQNGRAARADRYRPGRNCCQGIEIAQPILLPDSCLSPSPALNYCVASQIAIIHEWTW